MCHCREGGDFKPPDTRNKPNREMCAEFARRANKPYREMCAESARRAPYVLDSTISIEDNMIRYLNDVEENKATTVLAGVLSRGHDVGFLKKHQFVAIGIVRHPLHCYVSYFLRRHPEISTALGGIQSARCVEYFAQYWNEVYGDADSCIRFEFATEDAERLGVPSRLRQSLMGLNNSKRNAGVLGNEYEDLLRSRVADLYFSLYDKWEI